MVAADCIDQVERQTLHRVIMLSSAYQQKSANRTIRSIQKQRAVAIVKDADWSLKPPAIRCRCFRAKLDSPMVVRP